MLPQPVTAVRVVRDAATSVGKGIAFVEFRTKAAAQLALGLDGQKLDGRPLRITRVSAQQGANGKTGTHTASKMRDAGRKIFGHAGEQPPWHTC